MKKYILIILAFLFLGVSCDTAKQGPEQVTLEQIESEISSGHFTQAENLINYYLAKDSITASDRYELNYKKDLMRRIRRDFAQTEEEITNYLKQYYPDLTEEQMREWEEKNYLEVKLIDGERKYFNYAGRNFFRINKEENKIRIAKDGNQSDALTDFCREYAPEVIAEVKKTGVTTVDSRDMILHFTLTVDANAVPENEMVRCWLPYPRMHPERLPSIELMSVSEEEYTIADEKRMQRTLYMQKPAVKDKPTVFKMSIKISTAAQWFPLQPEQIQQYNKESALYKEHTTERPPHIVFSDQLKALTDSIVGNETNPFKMVRKIYTWIDDQIPWASALEYGIMENIPAYVLENMHGDCGMQTLLFMTMARYKGIPAKWQSGWMLHPGEVNLHDWAEVYYEGIGWVPVDQSFSQIDSEDPEIRYFYANGIDAYRLIVNDDYARPLFPYKTYPRSEPNDFQRGEVEWKAGNLYFDHWDYHMDVEYLD